MIVIVGNPAFLLPDDLQQGAPAGLAATIAQAAAKAGARVEMVGRVGDDPLGDELLLGLSRDGVGHAAILRDVARATPGLVLEAAPAPDDPAATSYRRLPTTGTATVPELDAADVELALRYLPEHRVIVMADPVGASVARAAADAAAFAGATLVAVVAAGQTPHAAFDVATVFEAPEDDADGAFAALVGRFAAAIDAGRPIAEAFGAVRLELGWEPVAS